MSNHAEVGKVVIPMVISTRPKTYQEWWNDAKQQQRLDEILAMYEALKTDVRVAVHGTAFGVDASTTIQ